jgi:hypothetical protein
VSASNIKDETMNEMKIHTTMDIAAPAAEAWRLLGEGFGDWADWSPGIDSSMLEGPLAEGVMRVNKTPSLGTVRQELVRFDREAHALAYEVRSGLPPFLVGLRNDWVIEAVGPDRCRLNGDAVFVLAEEAVPIRSKLEGKMGVVLQAFAMTVRETLEGGVEAESV